ncbi:MAG: FAD-dependent oxidoreductase, partial [Treponema sp.]|nr:FAD-dependent oxidoreductase [Treponema sp.]
MVFTDKYSPAKEGSCGKNNSPAGNYPSPFGYNSDTPLPPDSDTQAERGSIPGEFRGSENLKTEAAKSGMRQKVTGIVTERGRIIPCRAVVLTTGTFLGGRIFIGEYDAPCGRVG